MALLVRFKSSGHPMKVTNLMSHPNRLIRPSRIEDLQGFLVHAIVVAGKNADTANAAIDRFYAQNPGRTPFAKIRRRLAAGELHIALKKARIGNYRKNTLSLRQLVTARINLRTCTVEDLEQIHGIGPKTARYFLLYTRPDAQVAALDVHMLKFLRVLGYDVPKTTPASGPTYNKLETLVLELADAAKLSPRELDAAVWAYFSKHEGELPAIQSAHRPNLRQKKEWTLATVHL